MLDKGLNSKNYILDLKIKKKCEKNIYNLVLRITNNF